MRNVLGYFFAEVGYHVPWSMDETCVVLNARHLEQVMTDPQRLATTREESEIRWPYPPLNESKRPNVVVIVLDDVGFGQTSKIIEKTVETSYFSVTNTARAWHLVTGARATQE